MCVLLFGNAPVSGAQDMQFDRIVGALEEVLMDPQFTAPGSSGGGEESIFDFCYNNCGELLCFQIHHHFSSLSSKKICGADIFDIDSEENKLEYTPLFDRYVEKVGESIKLQA
jgi:hypothetical protein